MDLQQNYKRFEDLNTEILAIAVHDVERARRVTEVSGTTFPVLADPNRFVSEAYGVYNLLGDGLATPAIFIIDVDGTIAWSYVGKDPSDRPTAEDILSRLPNAN